jgi:hypothetical protein
VTAAELAALRRLRTVGDLLEPGMRDKIERALRQLQSSVSLRDLEQMLARRDMLALHKLVDSLPARLRLAAAQLEKVFIAGASAGVVAVKAAGARISFALHDFDVIAAARHDAARMVTGVTLETQAGIRTIITEAVSGLHTPREAARLIRPMIGLTKRQAIAVERFRVAQIAEKGLTKATALARAERYAAKLLKRRAETIARTEIIRACANGQLAAWNAAAQRGKLLQGARKRWMVTKDDRLCPRCRAMDQQTVRLAGDFQGPHGDSVPAPPLHPNCRCAIVLVPMTVAVPAWLRSVA